MGKVCPQVNKFEQVSSNDYQMSVAMGGYPRGGYPKSHVLGRDVHYHMSYPMMHVMLPPLCGQTDICKNITFPQLVRTVLTNPSSESATTGAYLLRLIYVTAQWC